MSDVDDLPFDYPAPATPTGARAKRHRHDWQMRLAVGEVWSPTIACLRCGKVRDATAVRRGRTSLRAGKDAERRIAAEYGGQRVGQAGGPEDVVTELFAIQSKAGGWFVERYWDELQKLPRTGGRIPTLIVSDRPGPVEAVLALIDEQPAVGLDVERRAKRIDWSNVVVDEGDESP